MRICVASAFTDNPFKGNTAAVCFLDAPRADAELQLIAAELRQPVTAFLKEDEGIWNIRWFTPQIEIDLCGHATLAAAFGVWTLSGRDERSPLFFRAPGQLLQATPVGEHGVQLEFPARFGRARDVDEGPVSAVDVRPIAAASFGDRWLFEYETSDEVRRLRPHFDALRALAVRALMVTAVSDLPQYDIISRNFPPLTGINEDQVTGVAHTCLATYWRRRFGDTLRCYQASSRGGSMITTLRGDRVLLEGKAVLQFRGDWLC